jgi:hypothetical protein
VTTGGDEWRAARDHAAAEQLSALRRRKAKESARARSMLVEFVAACNARGIEPQPLRATAYDGRTTYRTPVTGWYLKPDRTVAVGTDGTFYVLTTPTSLRARLAGVTPSPEDPPLQVGAGGRDGDSVALDTLLALRLREPIR